ncbi:MAG TPA: site-specific integrase [Candidatus Saccharimonadales bacterium]|nr:site-specific integrase [Candidatus Saccharimonadales bacterium]
MNSHPISAPRFQITADDAGRPVVTALPTGNTPEVIHQKVSAARRKCRKPVLFKSGAVTVKLYRYTWRDKKRGRTYVKFAVTQGSGRRRVREYHADQEVAARRAQEIADAIANGQVGLGTVSPADWATYTRAQELIRPLGKTLELAASEYAQALATLKASRSTLTTVPTLQAVVDFWVLHHPAGGDTLTCPKILEEMIAARRQDGASKNTLDDYRSRLGRFVQDFTGPISAIGPQDLDAWLAKLPVSRRTRNNYRGNLVDFYAFARRRAYVPKDWAPMASVPKLKNEPVRIEIFTPEEIAKLLAARVHLEAEYNRKHPGRPIKTLIPYLAIAAFAGVRNEEMCRGLDGHGKQLPRLDWAQVDLEAGDIEILKSVAGKTGRSRLFVMSDNLRAWLKGYAKPNGPVCPFGNVVNALLDTARAAGVPWKDNGLRKSFISYRYAECGNIGQVAREAGTSPQKISSNYEKPAPKREAKRWFNVHPASADILQLPLFATGT